MPKLALISDTHGMLPSPETFHGADAIVHAGDIGPDYLVTDWITKVFLPWREALPCPLYATLGNHDFPDKWGIIREHLLIDQVENVCGLKTWFSPWSPKFFDWAWMRDEDQLVDLYSQIPDDVEMIVSHSPAWQILDKIDLRHCGSVTLNERIWQLKKLKYVVCGHIHAARGQLIFNNVYFFNVSSVDEMYEPLAERITWLEI